MTRLLIVAVLAVAAAPAMACPWGSSASTDTKPATVASQPADQTTPPPPATQTPS